MKLSCQIADAYVFFDSDSKNPKFETNKFSSGSRSHTNTSASELGIEGRRTREDLRMLSSCKRYSYQVLSYSRIGKYILQGNFVDMSDLDYGLDIVPPFTPAPRAAAVASLKRISTNLQYLKQ